MHHIPHKLSPYELYNGRKPNISHLHVFGCKCFVLNNGKDNIGKFDAKSDEGENGLRDNSKRWLWLFSTGIMKISLRVRMKKMS